MYVWIWRRLPGGLPGKLTGSLLLLAAALALLFFLVFPWAEKRLPFNDVSVDKPGTSTTVPAGSSPSPSTQSP
jgi:hypothetical protein